MKYWLGKNGQQLGPYELADLQRMLAQGEIGAGDLAWTQGMANWAPALEVVRPAPPAPAPPAATIPLIPVAIPHFTARPDLSIYGLFFALSLVNWKYLLLGFILFRVFDIWKPFPIRRLEKLPGGWGIMADDWMAGIYAAILLRLALHFNLV